MTTHRESADITAVIAALTHTSVSTKKAVLTTLMTSLDSEQGIVDSERQNLHEHKGTVQGMIDHLTVVQDGEEYTVSAAGSGVFTAAEKTQILADVVSLQAPVTPTVIANLSDNDNIALFHTDKIVLIQHDSVTGLTATLPSSGMLHGQIITIKNAHYGDASQGGNFIVTVVPAPGQSPTHTIDGKFTSLELKASTVAPNSLMSDENECSRLLWDSIMTTWWSIQDAY